MKEEVVYCSRCGHPIDTLYDVEGDLVCRDCMERDSFVCTRCGERFWEDHNDGDEDTPLCEECYYNGEYLSCFRCGRVLTESEARYIDEFGPYCDECYEKEQEKEIIHDYSYKPEPVFYGKGLRYMGVELEVDRDEYHSSSPQEDAKEVMELANEQEEQIYIKHDGSLNEGFEIVTHPMTLRYHRENMPWKEVCHLVVEQGYRSHMTDTCGLHVHVNRTSLGFGEIEVEATVANILFFLEKFWREMICFSRRTEGQLERWARRYGLEKQGSDILQKAKKGYYGRYVSLNLENKETIEFRIFRGTLKYNTLIATLELVNEICTVCAQLTEEEMQDLSWIEFVKRISNNAELVQYLKERSLYVNEPVTGEEEL